MEKNLTEKCMKDDLGNECYKGDLIRFNYRPFFWFKRESPNRTFSGSIKDATDKSVKLNYVSIDNDVWPIDNGLRNRARFKINRMYNTENLNSKPTRKEL